VRRTSIVATLGPASEDEVVLRRMLEAGVDVARINFSHGSAEDHRRRIDLVRRVAGALGRPVGILQDLQGPKIRLGRIDGGGVHLEAGDRVTLTPDDGALGSADRLGVSLRSLGRHIGPGAVVLVDDGRVRMTVESTSGDDVLCRVQVGGLVSDRKGVNVLGATLDVPSLTEKDLEDIAVGVECEVDLVALSFVRDARDIALLRARLTSLGSRALIVAKIEKHEALSNIDGIIEVADAVMVARGDLGVEIPPEQVPRWQKAVIRKATVRARAVITATQMLESMTGAPTPTRAEASDVANAVYDGTTAVMLSGETAVGDYPVAAVATMARIVETVEADLFGELPASPRPDPDALGSCAPEGDISATEAISRAACSLADDLGAAAILTPTRSGATARFVSRWRPRAPIIATTQSPWVQAQLCLEWGVVPLRVDEADDTDGTIRGALEAARAAGLLSAGDLAIVTCGSLVNVPGTTDLIKIERV
jgi:pyruvate kinase